MESVQLSAYRIVAELGSGGMGKVYQAEVATKAAGLEPGTVVALKVVHPHLLELPGFFKRFLREAQVGQQVQHDNVVRTYDCDATVLDGAQHNFLVMEYVEGQTLRDLLIELERVPEELCRHVGREIAKGLAAIHAVGVVHRDIKPENVLITEAHVIKVMDLGAAHLQDEVIRLSQAGHFVGSLQYAAPEHIQSRGAAIDGRTDLFALGVLLYELGTGRHPFQCESVQRVIRKILDETPRPPGEVNPQLSPFFEEVVNTLMAKDREARFESAAALAQVLEEGEDGRWWKERAKALRLQTKRPLRRIRIPRETALYGRDNDLEKLQALFDKAKEGDGQMLLVEGEAGIGKTRLVDEFIGRLRQQGEDINFLFGNYPPGGAATAAGAFSEAYREQFGQAGSAAWLPQTPILVPAFDALLRGEPTPKNAEALTRESLGAVFVHATRNLAKERPTVVMIDDLHFAPEDARSLFTTLSLALPGHRVLLVGTMRPGVDEAWIANLNRLDHGAHMNLNRLGPKDLTQLLKDAFRSERLAEELGYKIAEKSDGNPFFAFAIIRGLREGQFITQEDDGTWVSTQVIQNIQIPSSIQDLVNARVSSLTDEERDLLDVASCCGFDFDPLLVGQVVGMDDIALLKRLGRIEQAHRLVRTTGRRYTFDHHQVQESLYAGISELLRERYHAAIAEALEARENAAETDPHDLDGALCVDLCEHFIEGAHGTQALRYLPHGLDHLEQGYLNEEAIALSDRALAVSGLLTGRSRLEMLLRVNERLDLLGRRADQETVLEEALALAKSGDSKADRVLAQRGIGMLRWRTGHPEAARKHFERSLTLARETGDRESEARALGRLGVVARSQGDHQKARDRYDQTIAIAREIGDPLDEARATGNLGVVCYAEGAYDEAREHYERAGELFRQVGNRQGDATSSGNLGIVLHAQGAFANAQKHYERFDATCREIGDRQGEAVAAANLGVVLQAQGALEEAGEHVERSLEISREIEYPRGVAHALQTQATPAFQRGDVAEAERLLRQALDLGRKIGQRDALAATLVSLGGLLGEDGQREEAETLLEEAIELAAGAGVPGTEVLARCRLALARPDALESALASFAEKGERLRHDDRMEAHFLLWRATHEVEHLERARTLLAHLVDHASEPYRETMVANVLLHRDILQAET